MGELKERITENGIDYILAGAIICSPMVELTEQKEYQIGVWAAL